MFFVIMVNQPFLQVIIYFKFVRIFLFSKKRILRVEGLQGTYCDGKEFDICTVSFEFKSGRAPLVRV